jgi:hypothetical protein
VKICQHEAKIAALRAALDTSNKGTMASYHAHMQRKHRDELPEVWAAIDALLAPEGEAYLLSRQRSL